MSYMLPVTSDEAVRAIMDDSRDNWTRASAIWILDSEEEIHNQIGEGGPVVVDTCAIHGRYHQWYGMAAFFRGIGIDPVESEFWPEGEEIDLMDDDDISDCIEEFLRKSDLGEQYQLLLCKVARSLDYKEHGGPLDAQEPGVEHGCGVPDHEKVVVLVRDLEE